MHKHTEFCTGAGCPQVPVHVRELIRNGGQAPIGGWALQGEWIVDANGRDKWIAHGDDEGDWVKGKWVPHRGRTRTATKTAPKPAPAPKPTPAPKKKAVASKPQKKPVSSADVALPKTSSKWLDIEAIRAEVRRCLVACGAPATYVPVIDLARLGTERMGHFATRSSQRRGWIEREIKFNADAWPHVTPAERLEVIRHEAAHAVTNWLETRGDVFTKPKWADHGAEWRDVAIALGATGEAFLSMDMTQVLRTHGKDLELEDMFSKLRRGGGQTGRRKVRQPGRYVRQTRKNPAASDVKKAVGLLKEIKARGRMDDPTLAKKIEGLQRLVHDGRHYVTSKNRRTGFDVSVATAEGAGMNERDQGLNYYAICEEHGTLVGTSTRREAETAAASADFCDECRAIAYPRENPAPAGAITVVMPHEYYGPITWEYVGTVDALDTNNKNHPKTTFEHWYYGVPRVDTPGFGTTTWDVWVPRRAARRNGVGYTDAKIEKWQKACPHTFHADALAVMQKWEAEVAAGGAGYARRPPDRSLRKNPAPVDDDDVIYFHTTSFADLDSIAQNGLRPRRGRGVFNHGAYAAHSQGKVFLAKGKGSALEWFGKVEDQLQDAYGDELGPEGLVPMMLRVTLPADMTPEVDDVGSRDVLGDRGGPSSFFVTETVPPDALEVWHPGFEDWMPIDEFNGDVYDGVKSVEHYDEDGNVVGENDDWTGRGFFVFGPYDDGGFKPSKDDVAAWTPPLAEQDWHPDQHLLPEDLIDNPRDRNAERAFLSKAARDDIAAAAQEVYDAWEADPDHPENDDYGGGGICDDVAEAIAEVLDRHGLSENFTQNSEGVGENHTWVIVRGSDGVYCVDIPPDVYETGAGYSWVKIPGVRFSAADVVVEKLENDPDRFDEMMPD